MSLITKIISGGQTGVDQIGLDVARSLGIETGGTAAKNWMTENGPNPKLKEYGLVECIYNGYPVRTGFNVRDSHATVFFGEKSSGYYTTLRATVHFNRPFIYNPTALELIEFIRYYHAQILNIAGNRGSKLTPYLADQIQEILLQALGCLFIKRETKAPA